MLYLFIPQLQIVIIIIQLLYPSYISYYLYIKLLNLSSINILPQINYIGLSFQGLKSSF